MRLDSELLRVYAEAASEEAFSELVRRHLDLVYSAALRQVNGDTHLAQDVAQTVFTDLARKAAALSQRPVLTGWLYTSTHFAAAKAVRTERRRRSHEQEAHAMRELLRSPAPDLDWESLAPVLDKVMHQLAESDRDVILMRYFENRQLAQIGQRLGLSEDAARKRVDRALERLRTFLAKRGITTTASLTTGLSAHAVQIAPAGMAATLTSASLAGAAAETGTTVTLLKLMATTNLKAAVFSAVLVVSAGTPWLVQHRAQARLREQSVELGQQTEQQAKLQRENQHLSDLAGQPKIPTEQFREVLRLRGEIGRLQQDLQQLAQSKAPTATSRNDMIASMAKLYSERVSQLKQLVETNPAEKIPELHFLTDDDWLWLAHKRPVDSEEGFRRAMSTTRQMAEEHFVNDLLHPALQQYAQEHNGQFPSEVAQLKAYFNSPVDDAILERWVALAKSRLVPALQRQLEEDWYVTQKSPVDAALDQRILRGLKGVHDFADAPPSFWDVVP